MKQNIVTASIVPDNRREKSDGKFPLKLRVTFKGKRKYYATGYDVDIVGWRLIKENRAKGELRKTSLALFEIQANSQKCCDGLDNFSFTKFESSFFPVGCSQNHIVFGS